MSEPTPSSAATGRIPHGPFRAGDQVQLTDPKGRINT
ncbi:MAG: tRNA (adenine-N1)-methyltransferase, partial [Actinomadura sp.]